MDESKKCKVSESKTSFVAWVKVHRKQLVAAGVSLAIVIGIIWGIRNKDELIKLWTSLSKCISEKSRSSVTKGESIQDMVPVVEMASQTESITLPENIIPNKDISVSQHIRNLPYGMHASEEKIRTANEHGFNLQSGQTWVIDYTKMLKAA